VEVGAEEWAEDADPHHRGDERHQPDDGEDDAQGATDGKEAEDNQHEADANPQGATEWRLHEVHEWHGDHSFPGIYTMPVGTICQYARLKTIFS
jgi:hypothetical protein